MKKFVCTVCGYVYEGEAAPEKCPVCGVPADKFKEQGGDRTWAAEHVVGIAQVVEQWSPKPRAVSSNLTAPAKWPSSSVG